MSRERSPTVRPVFTRRRVVSVSDGRARRLKGEDWRSAVSVTPLRCSWCGRPVGLQFYPEHVRRGDSGWRLDHVFVFPAAMEREGKRLIRRFLAAHPKKWEPRYIGRRK